MAERAAYDVDFDWDDAHGRLVALLERRSARGLVVDLGCGFAPHAEPLRDIGFTYVGLDVNVIALEAVRARGFDARMLDLRDLAATMDMLRDVVASAGEPLVAVLAIDVIEHLAEPQRLLAELSTWLDGHPDSVLGVSVPNVAHRDLASKLLAGRWDVTPTGLLDHTHLRFFTDRSLDAAMAAAAFVELARNDRPANRSDQWWPSGLATLSDSSRAGAWLRAVRSRADAYDVIYQFIRLFTPTGTEPDAADLVVAPRPAPNVFLSVVADPAMGDADLERLRTMLAEQTDDSWELLCAADHPVDDPDGDEPEDDAAVLARMLDAASGHHVSVVAAGDGLTPNWVEQFAHAADVGNGELTGSILRCARSDDDAGDVDGSSAWSELGSLDAASAMFAVPTEAIRGVRVHGAGDAVSPVAAILLEAVEYCGVTETGSVGVGAFRSSCLDPAVVEEWATVRDARPTLMPAGTRRRLVELERARSAAEHRADELAAAVETLERDNAWLNRELALAPIRVVRRVMRRGRTAD